MTTQFVFDEALVFFSNAGKMMGSITLQFCFIKFTVW